MIGASFVPEEAEQCTEVKRVNCPYFKMSFDTPQVTCTKAVKDQALEAKANYIYVDEPNVSVGGFKTSAPVAVFYQCENLSAVE